MKLKSVGDTVRYISQRYGVVEGVITDVNYEELQGCDDYLYHVTDEYSPCGWITPHEVNSVPDVDAMADV